MKKMYYLSKWHQQGTKGRTGQQTGHLGRPLGVSLLLILLGLLVNIILVGCPGNSSSSETDLINNSTQTVAAETPELMQTDITILFLGDSLTEGYDLAPSQSYPSLIEKFFNDSGKQVNIINAGISGDTTLGGLSRFQWYLENQTYDIDILFLALGANDGLRGLSIKNTMKNFKTIIEMAQASKMRVILAGMRIPLNYGELYTEEFSQMYDELEANFQLTRMDFLLEGVAGETHLNLPDGIHPNAEGYKIIANNVFKVIEPVVTSILKSRS